MNGPRAISGKLYMFIQTCIDMEKRGRPVPHEFVKWIAQSIGVWDEMVEYVAGLDSEVH